MTIPLPNDIIEKILVSRELYLVMRIECIANSGTKMNCLGIYGRLHDAQKAVVATMLEKDLTGGIEYYNPSKRYSKMTRGRIDITDMSFIQEDVWLDRWMRSSGICHYEIQEWKQNDTEGLCKKHFFNFDCFMKDYITKHGWDLELIKECIKNGTLDLKDVYIPDMFHLSPINWKPSIESDSREAWHELHGFEEATDIQTHPFSFMENALTLLMNGQ